MRQRMMILGLLAFAAMPSFAADKAPLQASAGSAAAVTPAGGGKPVVVNGCGSCASGSAAHIHNRPFGGGTVNPTGCGCWASERTFLWGGCKQFFNPQFSCGDGHCGKGLGNRERCPVPTYGPGVGTPPNNCAGTFSYLNR
jgi:hypothetical protein